MVMNSFVMLHMSCPRIQQESVLFPLRRPETIHTTTFHFVT